MGTKRTSKLDALSPFDAGVATVQSSGEEAKADDAALISFSSAAAKASLAKKNATTTNDE